MQPLQVLGRPALLGDRLPGQVHHRIGGRKGRLQIGALPAGGLGGLGLQTRELRVRDRGQRLSGATHQDKLVPLLQQQRHQSPAHKPAAAHQQDPHARAPDRSGPG